MWNVSPQPIWPACDSANQLESEAVQCIDDATRYLEGRSGRARWRRSCTVSRVWRKVPVIVSALLLFSLLAFGAQMLASARHDRRACEDEYNDCMAEQQELALSGAVLDQSSLALCSSLVQVQSLSDSPGLACDMATSRAVLGMAAWRWLLFLGLFWPAQIAALVLVKPRVATGTGLLQSERPYRRAVHARSRSAVRAYGSRCGMGRGLVRVGVQTSQVVAGCSGVERGG